MIFDSFYRLHTYWPVLNKNIYAHKLCAYIAQHDLHDENFNIKVKFKANNGTFPKEIIFSMYNRLSLPLRASRSNEVAESVPHY